MPALGGGDRAALVAELEVDQEHDLPASSAAAVARRWSPELEVDQEHRRARPRPNLGRLSSHAFTPWNFGEGLYGIWCPTWRERRRSGEVQREATGGSCLRRGNDV
jgi:hypothetical protein